MKPSKPILLLYKTPSLQHCSFNYAHLLILTSELFGLPTTLDEETQKTLDDKHRLTAKQQQGRLSNEERKELDEALQKLEGLGFTRTFRDPLYQKFVIAWHQQKRFQKPSLTPEEVKEQNELALSLLREIMEEEQ